MSTDKRTCKDDQKCSLKAFDVSYSLNGTRWFKMGRVENLTGKPLPLQPSDRSCIDCQGDGYGQCDDMAGRPPLWNVSYVKLLLNSRRLCDLLCHHLPWKLSCAKLFEAA